MTQMIATLSKWRSRDRRKVHLIICLVARLRVMLMIKLRLIKMMKMKSTWPGSTRSNKPKRRANLLNTKRTRSAQKMLKCSLEVGQWLITLSWASWLLRWVSDRRRSRKTRKRVGLRARAMRSHEKRSLPSLRRQESLFQQELSTSERVKSLRDT